MTRGVNGVMVSTGSQESTNSLKALNMRAIYGWIQVLESYIKANKCLNALMGANGWQ